MCMVLYHMVSFKLLEALTNFKNLYSRVTAQDSQHNVNSEEDESHDWTVQFCQVRLLKSVA